METNKQKVDFTLQDRRVFVKQTGIKDAFMDAFIGIHKVSKEDAESAYKREILYCDRALSESPNLQSCTQISLFSAFLEIAITGLSLQPGGKSDAYLESRGTKNGKDQQGNDIWINIARLCITAYGELNMRIRAGQIIRMNNPIVIYEGDKFQPRTNEQGVLIIDYMPIIPRKSNTIIGCYVCIVLPGGGLDFKWLLQDDIQRLAGYSKPRATTRNQNPQENALYHSVNGQIDPGFLEAKTIKHAMRAYTRLKVGDSVAFDGEEEFETPETSTSFENHTSQPETTITGIVKIDMGDSDQPF